MSIIIPMIVEAYLSDGIDAETKRVPQVSPDYSTALYHSFLGSQNTPSPIDSVLPPLERGVHLHFIIPDAFKQADDTGSFPPVPDRYIVTRFITSEKTITARQWVVESNFISLDEQYADNVSIPMFSAQGQAKFRYCGRAYDLSKPPLDQGEYLPSLTAIGGGDPLFAAYYPSCHSIFGFHDNMAGMAEGAEISYFVTGLFSDSTQDPFHGIQTQQAYSEILEKLQFSVPDAQPLPDKALLFGAVSGIKWTNGTISDDIPKGNIDVAIGKTSAEALSAAVDKLLSFSDPAFQRFFTALQYEETEKMNEIDGQYSLDDEIILRQFQRIDGQNGTYTLTGDTAENNQAARSFSNILKDKLDLGEDIRLFESEKQKLFCLWEQYMLLYENSAAPKIPSRTDILTEITAVSENVDRLRVQIEKKQTDIKDGLSSIMEPTGEEPFYIPKEPALLFCGDGVNRSYAFGENGRFTNDGTLSCQISPLSCNITAEKILSLLTYRTPDLLPEYDLLLTQALLLIPETKQILEQVLGPLTINGELSPLALNTVPGDFITLFMDWQMLFYPIRTSKDTEPDNTLSHCSFTYGETDFTTGEAIANRSVTYSGRSVLTPHATINLKQRLLHWISAHDKDEDAKHAAELLDTLPIISQNLGGVNDLFSAKMQAYQFPIMGNGGDTQQADAVSANLPTSRTSVLTDYPLFPLRGGYFRIPQINIIGTFGQKQQIYAPSSTDIPDTVYSETLQSNTDKFGYLCPGFITPSRLSFRWISDIGYSCSAENSTPVFGFIVPELLNHRLVIYDISGMALGEIKTVRRNGESSARWISAPGFPKKLSEVRMDDTLKKFLTALVSIENAFAEIISAVDAVISKTLPDSAEGAIWGKALALAKAEISLDFWGEPDFTKSFSAFKQYNTLGVKDVKIPLCLGDADRALDGFIGAFPTDDFSQMYPAFGAVSSAPEMNYIQYGQTLSISNSDGNTSLYLLFEASSLITVQTGLHPVKTVRLLPEHAAAAEQLTLFAEINPFITPDGRAELSLAEHLSDTYTASFSIKQGNEAILWPVVPPKAVLNDTLICDGRIALSQQSKTEVIRKNE